MQTLTLGLIRGHEKELRTLPSTLPLCCDVLVTICEGVDPIVQQESLIVESTQSPFLGLYDKGEIWFAYEVQGVGMWIIEDNREIRINNSVSCRVGCRGVEGEM